MSMMDEIKKMIEADEKYYLYSKIINILDKYKNKYHNEYLNQIKDDKISLIDEILKILDEYVKYNKISILIIGKGKKLTEKIEQYFDSIIEFLKNKKDNFKLTHIQILKNLLTSAKSVDALKNYKDLSKKKKYTIKNFIVDYSVVAIEKLLKNKSDEFKQNDSDELTNLYLYFIFQIKDSENLNKLKLYVYTYLYVEKDLNKFINKSSEEIVKKGNIDPKVLREWEIKYNELNMIINNVSEDMITYYGQDLRKSTGDFLKFFIPDVIKKNYHYATNDKIEITEDKIVIDDLNYNKDKIHLFSPQFLLVNGLKSHIEENDFKIFNKDNYSVDLFAKFLRNIIGELNKNIDQNNYQNDFIIKHLIEFHKKNLSLNISAKLDYNDKNDLNNYNNQNNDKNPFIKIKIYQKKNYNDYNQIKNKDNTSNKNKELSNESKKNLNENNDLLKDKNFSSTNSFSEKIKEESDYFENTLNMKFVENIGKEKIIPLPNIVFRLNLKIPVYNENKNSIEFKSVHLDYCGEENPKTNYYAGYKEIDSVFKNCAKENIDVGGLKYFHVNFKFIKAKNEISFEQQEFENENFYIYSNSIFFCEIKKSFPSITRERKEVINIKIKKPKISENVRINEELGGLVPYSIELDKLIRKFFFFLDIYLKNKNGQIPNNMQIVLLYDFLSVDKIDPDFKEIKKVTKDILESYSFQDKIKKKLNIIFQLIFFDNGQFIKDKDIKINEQENKILENEKELRAKNDLIQKKDATIKQKDVTIQQKDDLIKEKENTIQQKDDLIKEKDDKIYELYQNTNLTDKEKWDLLMKFMEKQKSSFPLPKKP